MLPLLQCTTRISERSLTTHAIGSYLLISSTGCWVLTTLITQCLDPPGILQHWRTTPNKNSQIIPDMVVENWQPRPRSETHRSRSSESQCSRLSQQNVPRIAQSISTSNVQPSLVARSVVDWDRADAMKHSLFGQTSVGTSEMMAPPNVNFYPAGETTAEFSQLSFSHPTNRSAQPVPYYAQFSISQSRPTTERLSSTTVQHLEPAYSVYSAVPDARSQFSEKRSVTGKSASVSRSRGVQIPDHASVDTGLSSLEELIAQAVSKNTRSRSVQFNANKANNGMLPEKGTRSTSPLTLGSLDTDDEGGAESILNPCTGESKERDISTTLNGAKEREEYVRSEEILRGQLDLNGDTRGKRTTSLSNRSWNPTGLKYMRICNDSDFKLNSPPLEISINVEESDDFILDPIGTKENAGRSHVVTPDAKNLWTVASAGRSASFGGERHHEDRRSWEKSSASVKSDVGGWLRAKSAANRLQTSSSASIISTSSSRLGSLVQEATLSFTANEMDKETFYPYAAQRPRQRSLSTPNIYEASSVFASRLPKVSDQVYDNRKEFPRSELDRPPLMRTNLVPRKEGKSPLPPRGRGNEISSLMSEEFSGRRVVNWVTTARTHTRSRSVPRDAIERASHPFKGDARSVSDIDNASVSRRTNSIFRQDRDKRAGIHAPAVITVDSGDDDDGSFVSSKSQLARKARDARLRRLAASRYSSRTSDEDTHVVLSNIQIAEKARQARANRLKATMSSQH